MKNLILIIFVLLFAGCQSFGGTSVNFQDGTWSTCTYSKPDGTSWTAPLQVGGVPMGYTQPDGTKVQCVPIPKAPAPPASDPAPV